MALLVHHSKTADVITRGEEGKYICKHMYLLMKTQYNSFIMKAFKQHKFNVFNISWDNVRSHPWFLQNFETWDKLREGYIIAATININVQWPLMYQQSQDTHNLYQHIMTFPAVTLSIASFTILYYYDIQASWPLLRFPWQQLPGYEAGEQLQWWTAKVTGNGHSEANRSITLSTFIYTAKIADYATNRMMLRELFSLQIHNYIFQSLCMKSIT